MTYEVKWLLSDPKETTGPSEGILERHYGRDYTCSVRPLNVTKSQMAACVYGKIPLS
jgi:hypothetical protein